MSEYGVGSLAHNLSPQRRNQHNMLVVLTFLISVDPVDPALRQCRTVVKTDTLWIVTKHLLLMGMSLLLASASEDCVHLSYLSADFPLHHKTS